MQRHFKSSFITKKTTKSEIDLFKSQSLLLLYLEINCVNEKNYES